MLENAHRTLDGDVVEQAVLRLTEHRAIGADLVHLRYDVVRDA